MYCIVKLFNGYLKPLTYQIPHDLENDAVVGSIVQVPLQKRTERGLICDIIDEHTSPFLVRPVEKIEPIPHDQQYHQFITQLSAYYGIDPRSLYRRLHQPKKNNAAIDGIPQDEKERTAWHLTTEQQIIVDTLAPYIQQPTYYPSLLHGVTGSGKTAVYQELMRIAHAHNKSCLFIIPEVSLAVTIARIFRNTFGTDIPVHEYHSATPQSHKHALWHDIVAQRPIVLVGVHLPVLIPLANLGLIIVDEEHDGGFQEKKHPRLNSKEAALMRAQHYKIPILLGSATPSVCTLHTAEQRAWKLFKLTKRFSGQFPIIERAAIHPLRKKNSPDPADFFWITRELRAAIEDRLSRKEQTILFLNRRGLNRFVQCTGCAHIFMCNACSVSLTLHNNRSLMCHYCGAGQSLPPTCPSCSAPESDFLKKGIGTQRIVEIARALFPAAHIARADTDSTKEKKGWSKTMEEMRAGTIDILVGTQTITKGYHFPRVTLVGIIWAESNLSIPFYSAVENTVQQLLQVAGRAGRASAHSKVIVQSFIDHPLFGYLDETKYHTFFEYELAQRASPKYPPLIRLSEIELHHEDEAQLDQDAQAMANALRKLASQDQPSVQILGPALPPVHRIQHVSVRKIYIKSSSIAKHIALFHATQRLIVTHKNASRCFFTPNPLQ